MAIYVTKSFMPPIEEYEKYLEHIYASGILTNQGPLVKEFEKKMSEFLGVDNFQYVTNGTIALQLAISALGIDSGEIITTPFSYVATITSILWQRCKPVFVDIEPDNFTIDVNKIEKAITKETKAILPVHVFGYACDVEKIQEIADNHNLKVIYDGAHAFASKYKGKSLLSYGDITTCSFHATKLFHTIEGGACIIRDKAIADKLDLQKRFGHQYDEYKCVGINGKQSEFNAAMGLANFPYIGHCIRERKRISTLYNSLLNGYVVKPKIQNELEYNYAYYPVIFKTEKELLNVFSSLNTQGIYPRRYFYPSLNMLNYLSKYKCCPISENITKRIACLPLYPDLKDKDIVKISEFIRNEIK